VQKGKIKVEGSHVVMDMTNDLRGARTLPRAAPEEVTDRVGRLVAAVKEKGAIGVTICETKPMRVMNVTPLSDMLRRKCQAQKVGWRRVTSVLQNGTKLKRTTFVFI
jgi:hypothetical protein